MNEQPSRANTADAREAALLALLFAERERGRLDETLRTLCTPLPRRDAALARQLCYGVLQKSALLDMGLRPFARAEELELRVRLILRLGAYQRWFLDRVPPHAIVNEAVNQAHRHAPRAARLCNAVLRRLPDEAPTSSDPCVRHSIAPWFFQRLTALLGKTEAEAFLAFSDRPAPLTLHQNPLCPAPLPPDALPHPHIPGCVTVSALDTEALESGGMLVADAGARLCVMAADPLPGERVWDACAAPGGKTALMALCMEGRGLILATELSKPKLPLIRETVKRFSLTNVRTAQADASLYTPDGLYDLVLCDVPCSGFGVLRRKPDIRLRSEVQCATLPPRQLAIPQNTAKAVKPGGRLVYSTCTVLAEENEALIQAFLAANPDFGLEAFDLPLAGHCPGEVRLWPQRHGTDGFYICKMRRKNEP